MVGILTTVPGVLKTGLAVPIAVARDVQSQLDASGKVIHGWLGVDGDDDTDRIDGGAQSPSWSKGAPRTRPTSGPET